MYCANFLWTSMGDIWLEFMFLFSTCHDAILSASSTNGPPRTRSTTSAKAMLTGLRQMALDSAKLETALRVRGMDAEKQAILKRMVASVELPRRRTTQTIFTRVLHVGTLGENCLQWVSHCCYQIHNFCNPVL